MTQMRRLGNVCREEKRQKRQRLPASTALFAQIVPPPPNRSWHVSCVTQSDQPREDAMAQTQTARKDEPKTEARRFSVVDSPTPAANKRRLTPAQFVNTELAQAEKDSLGILTRNVGQVDKAELINLINISSSLKARYMIALLDMSPSHALSSSAHVDEVRQWRERYEELDRGVEILKRAVLDGTVKIKGLEGAD